MKDKSWGNKAFHTINTGLLLLFALIMIIPFLYIVLASFTSSDELMQKGFVLFPTKWSLDGYRYIFSTNTLFNSLLVTIYITVIGTLLNLIFTSLTAYPLARKNLDGRRIFQFLVLFTMLFNGGMIPTFLIVKATGLLDSTWSLMIPGLISAFNLIIMRNFFQQIPEELIESSKIDGAHEFGTLLRIVLPLSMPAIATFSLFYAVGHWNSYFQAILYLNDSELWPIQVWLRQIVILAQGSGIGDSAQLDSEFAIPAAPVIKMTVIVISTVPILLVYPFLQKHFAKGVMLGSVKG